MIAVSDATPLIHMAKIAHIHLLKKLFDKIIIPKQVYYEITTREESEVVLIKNLIDSEYIKIKGVAAITNVNGLDKGENECIALCKELNIEAILIDENKGFDICQMFGLTPIRTTSLLFILLDKKIITLNKYLELLKSLVESNYYIDRVTYEKLVEIGKNIARK